MKLRTFKVWFTVGQGGWDEDYLVVNAMNAEQAFRKVEKANKDDRTFEIQSVETLD